MIGSFFIVFESHALYTFLGNVIEASNKHNLYIHKMFNRNMASLRCLTKKACKFKSPCICYSINNNINSVKTRVSTLEPYYSSSFLFEFDMNNCLFY